MTTQEDKDCQLELAFSTALGDIGSVIVSSTTAVTSSLGQLLEVVGVLGTSPISMTVGVAVGMTVGKANGSVA